MIDSLTVEAKSKHPDSFCLVCPCLSVASFPNPCKHSKRWLKEGFCRHKQDAELDGKKETIPNSQVQPQGVTLSNCVLDNKKEE